MGWQGSPLLLYGICISVAGYIAYRDIKFSTVSLLLLEAFSIGLILLLAGIVMWQHHLALDLPQLTLQGTTWSGMTIGLVLALLSYVGFESAATLGDEAVCPRRTIPQALLGSTITSGVFFILMAYVIVLGFRGYSIPLSQSDAPLSVLADLAGIEFVGTLIALTAMVSGFAGTLANLNAAGRILLALAQQRIIPRWLGKTHHRNDTPHLAMALVAIVAFLIAARLVLIGVRPLDILGYTGALLTDGYLIVYLLLAIAAPLYLRRLGQLRSPDVGIGIGAGLVLLIPIVNSIYPVPPAPYSFIPYLFLLWLVVGAAWFLWLLRTRASINIIPLDWYSQSSATENDVEN